MTDFTSKLLRDYRKDKQIIEVIGKYHENTQNTANVNVNITLHHR